MVLLKKAPSLPWLLCLLLLMLTLSVAESGPVGAQPGSRLFPETGKSVSGKFLAYWDAHGGLAQQGFPISEELRETSDTDGKSYTVQYFERAVFELHPEKAQPYDVLLSLLGSFLYARKYPGGAPDQAPNGSATSRLFPETGNRVGGLFLDYWNAHGGLPQQGYPLSDELNEVSELDGQPYRVQYFERAVFEYHPEKSPPYNVLLSQLGTFRYRFVYPASGPTPTTEAQPPTQPAQLLTATPPPPSPSTPPHAQPMATRTHGTTPVPTHPPGGQRCGAVCNDGTTSTATGAGACSRHGGVREWMYCSLLAPP